MAERGDSQSQFTARADDAARALRQKLQGEGRQMPDTAPVTVGPDGKPPAAPPPEGSYARMAMEEEAQRHQAAAPQPRAEDQPEPFDGGQQAQPLAQEPDPSDEQQQEQQLTDNASRRIRELVSRLKEKETENERLLDLGRRQGETLGQLQQRLEHLQQQHETLVSQNLEHLDPETRMQVMQDARIREALDGMEQRIMGQLMPHIQGIEQKTQAEELRSLGSKYPAFDIEIHRPLIEQFRADNPRCTVEQAFRAVAEPNELMTRASVRAPAVPPVVPPGNTSVHQRQHVQEQNHQQSDPEAELREESRRIRELRSSHDPSDQKAGLDLIHEHLRKRFGPR